MMVRRQKMSVHLEYILESICDHLKPVSTPAPAPLAPVSPGPVAHSHQVSEPELPPQVYYTGAPGTCWSLFTQRSRPSSSSSLPPQCHGHVVAYIILLLTSRAKKWVTAE